MSRARERASETTSAHQRREPSLPTRPPPPLPLLPLSFQLKAAKPVDAWYGTRTSSITRFLEASMGSQRDFSDAATRAGKADDAKLLFQLLWKDAEDGDAHKPVKYW